LEAISLYTFLVLSIMTYVNGLDRPKSDAKFVGLWQLWTICPQLLSKKVVREMSEKKDNDKNVSVTSPLQIRRVWHQDEWYYSIVDVIYVLTNSENPRYYWSKLKKRAKSEGFEETLTQIVQLKLKASDGRFRLTDTANRQTLLRLIQSIPSPRAEPFKIWLAQVGEERLEQIESCI
jgi:hypothetical protein